MKSAKGASLAVADVSGSSRERIFRAQCSGLDSQGWHKIKCADMRPRFEVFETFGKSNFNPFHEYMIFCVSL